MVVSLPLCWESLTLCVERGVNLTTWHQCQYFYKIMLYWEGSYAFFVKFYHDSVVILLRFAAQVSQWNISVFLPQSVSISCSLLSVISVVSFLFSISWAHLRSVSTHQWISGNHLNWFCSVYPAKFKQSPQRQTHLRRLNSWVTPCDPPVSPSAMSSVP